LLSEPAYKIYKRRNRHSCHLSYLTASRRICQLIREPPAFFSKSQRRLMRQNLSFEQYHPATDGHPPSQDNFQTALLVEIGEMEKTRLVREAGFGADQGCRIGILRRAWTSNSKQKHPMNSLIVVPHWNFTTFTADEHFSVSRERVQVGAAAIRKAPQANRRRAAAGHALGEPV
jgi:hypothetical protein